MPVLTLTLIAAILLAVAVPILVYGLVPVRAGVDARRLAAPVPGRAPGAGTAAADPETLPTPLRLIASAGARARIERNLALAGLTQAWPLARVLTVKLVATGVALALAIVFVVPAPS